MDTGSHLLFGATLAGLSLLQPEVAGQPELLYAMITATMIGSHAPDFDTVARMKGYAAYIRTHRGITHSLPALFVWPALLALPIAWVFGVWSHAGLLYLWTLVAVIFHVFLDWCNAYGVQCMRPFSGKWKHLDILPLFDPFMFGLHLTGLLLWGFTALPAGLMFTAIYTLTFVYIGLRAFQHRLIVRRVRSLLGLEGVCHIVPALHWFRGQFVLEADGRFYTGNIRGIDIEVVDVYDQGAAGSAVEASKTTDGVRAFLHFAQRVHVSCTEAQDGYIVQWRDVRFWHNRQLPFGVDVTLDRNLNVVSHSLGWSKKAWDPPFV